MTPVSWSDADKACLVENYPERGPAWVAAQLGRDRESVIRKARDLRVRYARSAEDTYRRLLAAFRADALEHGNPSPARVARALDMDPIAVGRRLTEARKRGDLPASARAVKAVQRHRATRDDDPGEPTEAQAAEIQAAIAAEHERKARRPDRWSVPVVSRPRRDRP